MARWLLLRASMRPLPRRLPLGLLSLALAAGIASARPAAPRPTLGREVSASDRSLVHEVSSHPTLRGRQIGKIVRNNHWVGDRMHVRDQATLRRYTAAVVDAAAKLHAAGGDVGALFRKIVPAVDADPDLPGWLFAERRRGVPLSEVPAAHQAKARAQIRAALAHARRILGDVNEAEDNFLFDGNFELSGWTSVVPQPVGEAQPYRMIRRLDDGTSINMEAWEIVNEAPGDADLRVLKRVKPFSQRRNPQIATEEIQRQLVADIVDSGDVLTREVNRKMGFRAVPRNAAGRPGLALQEMVVGTPIDQADPRLVGELRDLARQIIRHAETALPGAIFSIQLTAKHFLVDRLTNKPVWFDWLSDNNAVSGGRGRDFRSNP